MLTKAQLSTISTISEKSGKDYISHEASSAALAVEGGRGAEIGGRRERKSLFADAGARRLLSLFLRWRTEAARNSRPAKVSSLIAGAKCDLALLGADLPFSFSRAKYLPSVISGAGAATEAGLGEKNRSQIPELSLSFNQSSHLNDRAG
ncbi:hypothetical protein AOLI_G00067610 [Acnodon oligacanthus]